MTGDKLVAHRSAYARAVEMLNEHGMPANGMLNGKRVDGNMGIRLAQSYLMSEIPINLAYNQYQMCILTTQANQGNNGGLLQQEKRLLQQDVFFAYNYKFFVRFTASALGNTQWYNELMTFPNPMFYGELNLDQACGLWTMSYASLKINGFVITPYWNHQKHLYIPETQVQVPSGPPTQPIALNQFEDSKIGHIIEPNWVFNGGNDNEFNINFDFSLASLVTGNVKMNLVCYWEGFLAQNASSIMGISK